VFIFYNCRDATASAGQRMDREFIGAAKDSSLDFVCESERHNCDPVSRLRTWICVSGVWSQFDTMRRFWFEVG